MGAACKSPARIVWLVLGGAVGLLVVWLLAFGPFSGNGREPFAARPESGGQEAGMSELAQRGAEAFRTRGCSTCHSSDGRSGIGPSMRGVWGRERELTDGRVVVADAAYIRESIIDPGAKVVQGYLPSMASYAWLSDEEIDALVAFIEALGD